MRKLLKTSSSASKVIGTLRQPEELNLSGCKDIRPENLIQLIHEIGAELKTINLSDCQQVCKKRGQFSDAKSKFLEAATIYEKVYGKDHSMTQGALNQANICNGVSRSNCFTCRCF
ncbi:hypothetical protein N9N03_02880 [Chlamydiia bacterium]|nr:hypothetical protein [Chlamydiia bacterium]